MRLMEQKPPSKITIADLTKDCGTKFVWFFCYMPADNEAGTDLPDPEQREAICWKIREYRAAKPVFPIDFQNDGGSPRLHRRQSKLSVHQCRRDIEPCACIHHSGSDIREKAGGLPVPAVHSRLHPPALQRQPPAALSHAGEFQDAEEDGAPVRCRSTDLQFPESAGHLCDKCAQYAACWVPKAEELWIQRKKNSSALALVKKMRRCKSAQKTKKST